jgi:glycosyltransferase involved in cell wall biosynthesis
MHVRNTTGQHGVYGAEQCILSWMDEMRRRSDAEFVVVCFVGRGQESNHFVELVRQRGIPVETISMRQHQLFGVVRNLTRLIRHHQVDLLHTHENRSDIVGYLAARRAGVPVVATIHGFTNETWKTGLYNRLNLAFLRFAHFARLICVSNSMRRQLSKRWRSAPNLVTIHNGIEHPGSPREEMNGNLRSELGLRRHDLIVGVVGRLAREKGQRVLLEAAPRILEDHRRAVFLLVGDGPDRALLEARARELGLEQAVRFLGYRRDALSILRQLDLLAVPSSSEGISMVLLEAMGRGIPVVATRVGGTPEVMQHGVTGLMVPPDDPRSLAVAVSSLLERTELAREMGQEGEKRIRETFPVSLTANRIRRVYEEAVSLPSDAPGG